MATLDVSIPETLASKIKRILGMGGRINMAFVDRETESGEPMMLSTQVTSVFNKTERTTLAAAAMLPVPDLDIPRGPHPTYDTYYATYEKTLHAKWHNVSEKQASAAADAAVSGPLGTLNVSAHSMELDVIDPRRVSAEFLKQYNAELIPEDEEVEIDCGAYDDLLFIDYRFNNRMNYASPTSTEAPQGLYMDTYVFNPKRGGGQTLETHAFPHYWVRRSPDCTGAVLLARKVEGSEDEYKFAMFSVPEGYSFKAGSDAMHSDSWLHGNYAVSLNIGEVDVVSMRTEKDDELLHIKQVPQTVPADLSLFAPPKFPGLLMKYGATSVSSVDDVSTCIESIAKEISPKHARDQFDKYCQWYRANRGHAEQLDALEGMVSDIFSDTPAALEDHRVVAA